MKSKKFIEKVIDSPIILAPPLKTRTEMFEFFGL